MVMRRAAVTLAVLVCLAAGGLGLSGCKKPVNEDAVKLGKAGSTVSGQMAAYYETLQQDVMETWRLEAFEDAYRLRETYDDLAACGKLGSDDGEPSTMLNGTETRSIVESTKTYKALAARLRLARTMQGTYASYAQLAGYDYAGDVADSTDSVVASAAAVAGLALPGSSSLVSGCLKDLGAHTAAIRQNRALLRESETIVQLLAEVCALFDAERPLYCDLIAEPSEGPQGNVYVAGIVGERILASEKVALVLVEEGLAVPEGALGRAAEQYGLRLVDPADPLARSIRDGVEHSIRAETFARAQLYSDAGAAVSRNLGTLIEMHRTLRQGGRVTLEDVVENSALAQALLDTLAGGGEAEDSDG